MAVLAAFVIPHPPIILPEVGRGEEIKLVKTSGAYRQVMERVAALKPDTIVLISPHTILYADYFHISPGKTAKGDFGRFGAPKVRLAAEYDEQFVQRLSLLAQKRGIPAGTLGEREKSLDHGTMIPLRFLNQAYTEYKLVRIGLSGLPPTAHYGLGKCICEAADQLGRRVVVLASGDLSHKLLEEGPYGFAPQGPDFDAQVTDALANGDFLRLLTFDPAFADAAAECGLRAFQIMAGALDEREVTHVLLAYEGPFGVGYGVAAFEVKGVNAQRRFDVQYSRQEQDRVAAKKAEEDAYVRLARLGLETYVSTGKRAMLPENVPEEMTKARAGVFVSLKAHGRLRGCIGSIAPTADSVAAEILKNAVLAAVDDPRFDPVGVGELKELVYSVDVLGQIEPASVDGLDVKRYGVVVQSGRKRGLLLPNLEGVDTVEEQISIARQKAGIGHKESIELFRFEVVRHT